MFIVGLLGWWYGQGWRGCISRALGRLATTADFFSVSLLLRTLFSPFRQISAGGVRGPLGVQIRALFDRLVSRLIGAMVRSAMIIAGCVVLAVQAIFGGLVGLGWLLLPAVPLVGLALTFAGWMPW
jgi:hypothetical protein